ncbi:MAG: hypothetical protein ACXVXO_08025 [Mycobacteriaceae bacterium]
MTTTLTAVIAQPPSGRSRAVVLDAHDYAQSVILQGRDVPWHEPMAYSNFFAQAQGLLTPDVALLSLDRFYAHALSGNTRLHAAMSTKTRTGYALRTLLGDAETTRQAVEIATIFAKTQREPVVLHIPSPMQWLARTHHYSGSAEIGELDADDAENVSMYVADWLRGFASLPLAGVLLDDRAAVGGPIPATVELGTYSPVANVTDHYRWSLGLRRADHVEIRAVDSVGAVISPDFWLDEAVMPPSGDFLVGEIPRTAVPEHVLTRISTLS